MHLVSRENLPEANSRRKRVLSVYSDGGGVLMGVCGVTSHDIQCEGPYLVMFVCQASVCGIHVAIQWKLHLPPVITGGIYREHLSAVRHR